jgi:hypothetical protein
MRSGPDQRSRGRSNANRPSHEQRRAPQDRQPQDRQPLDSRGPGERIRGSAAQIAERYLALARDTARSEDRVAAERYYQFAEHYLRVSKAGREGDQQGGAPPPAPPADVEMGSAGTVPSDDQIEGSQPRWDAPDPGSTEAGIR